MPTSPVQTMQHGGDLGAASEHYGIAPADWLDLSTGINARPYPASDLDERIWTRLPQADGMAELIAAARTAYAVPGHLDIVAVPGTQAAIQWIPMTLDMKDTVAIRTPTFTEHATSWRIAGHIISESRDIETGLASAVAVVVNPNNPDGVIETPERVLSLWRRNAKRRLLVVDEAFADCDPSTSVVPKIRDEPVVVLRSFGKFFGLAGLRLGFAVARPPLAADLSRRIGPWAVSGPAIAIGTAALSDKTWIRETRKALAADRAKFDAILARHAMTPVGTVPLFCLVEHVDAGDLHRHLAQNGIWTRVFASNPTWLRFGIPRTDADRDRVDAALAGF